MDRKIQRCGLTYSGKTVLITGGSKGIGEGCARVFCDAGANVVLCARGQETGARLAAELDARGPGKCAFFPCDVGDTEQIARLVRDTVSRFGRLDCLINNAGYHPAHKRIDDFSCEALREILNVNLVSYFAASKYALEHIRKTRGTIINMSSLVGQIGQEQATIYCASKGAITAFSKALAMRSRLCSRLEVLQDQCVRNLQIELSFALERTPGVWSGLAQRYADVNNAFTQRDSQNNVIVRHASDDGFTGTPRMEPEMRLAEQACAQLELKRHDALEALQTLLGTSIFAKTGRDVYLYYQLSIPFLKRCGEEAVKMLAEIPYGRTWHDILEGFIYLTLQAERPRIDDSAKPQLVAQVCRYIDAHLDGDISLSVLSEKAHLNACYLSRVFKQTYGMNLSEYILQARVKKACKLLLDPSMKISEVMAEVGIESASYFACIFKRYMHVSPSDYRKSASL